MFPQNVFDSESDIDQPAPLRATYVLCMASIFAAIVLCITFTEFRDPDSLPLKSTTVSTVPLFNAWTIGWNAKQLRSGFPNYWDAPIFHPSAKAFAFSEPQPATMIIAPVVWATGSSIAGYKAWLILSLFLNGVFTCLLLRRLGYGTFYQVVGGCAMVFLPIVHQQIDVLQLTPVWGIVWFWSCLFQLANQPTVKTGIKTGVAFGMVFALCVHHALFVSLLLPFSVVVFVTALFVKRYLISTAISVVVAALIVLPIVIPIRSAAKANEFERKEKLVTGLSARPSQFLASSPKSLVKFSQFKASPTRQLCVGWVRMGFAILGIAYGLFWGSRRQWVLFMVLTAATAFAFSQGPRLSLGAITGDWKPWLFLSEYVPGFNQVRSAYRFAWFVQMAIILLSIEGLVAINAFVQMVCKASWRNAATCCLLVVPGVILAVEVLPEPAVRGGVPIVESHRNWIEFVKDNVAADQSIVCIPFASGTKVTDYLTSVQWMHFGLEHDVPMVNGYSGFFPQRVLDLRNRINKSFPSGELLDEFAELDVDLLVVMRKKVEPARMLATKSAKHRLVLLLEDPSGVDVYRLAPAMSWWP